MHPRYFVPLAALGALAASTVHAERSPGWEFGADLIYQDSGNIDFRGGSSASLEDDLGIALTFGYRFNSRFELQFSLDWNAIDYDANVASGIEGERGFTAEGDLESFTPRFGVTFNILEGDLTPYIIAGAGWAFIDTNIPDSPPQTTCWWDPWWGYYCGVFQSTRSIDEPTAYAGAGARWDVSSTISLRLSYEKHWLDLSEAAETPDFDQVKFGVIARY